MSSSFLNIHIFSSLEKPFCYRIVCHTGCAHGQHRWKLRSLKGPDTEVLFPEVRPRVLVSELGFAGVLPGECVHSSSPRVAPGTTNPQDWVGGGGFLPTTCRTVTSEHSWTRSKATGSPKHTAHFQSQRQTGQNKQKAGPGRGSCWGSRERV